MTLDDETVDFDRKSKNINFLMLELSFSFLIKLGAPFLVFSVGFLPLFGVLRKKKN